MPMTSTWVSMVSSPPFLGTSTWKADTAEASEPPATRASSRAVLVAALMALEDTVAPVMESTVMDWFSIIRGIILSMAAWRMVGVSEVFSVSTVMERISVSDTSTVTFRPSRAR